MSIRTDIYALLTSALGHSRVYPEVAPQKVDYPLCVYSWLSLEQVETKDSANPIDNYDISIKIYSPDVDTVESNFNSVRSALSRYAGDNTEVIKNIRYLSCTYDYIEEDRTHFCLANFQIRVKN